jgi:hypothetical protein
MVLQCHGREIADMWLMVPTVASRTLTLCTSLILDRRALDFG